MEVHHDWEFLEDGTTVKPISLGMVAEDGRSYQAVFDDMPMEDVKAHHWLSRNVWPHLPRTTGYHGREILDFDHPLVKSRIQIRADVLRFLMDTPDLSLWGWFPAYDHVCLAQLWGRMVELPAGVPMRTSDVAQEWDRLGRPRIPEQPDGAEHHPLADARWSLFLRQWLKAYDADRSGLVRFLPQGMSLGNLEYPAVPTAEDLLR